MIVPWNFPMPIAGWGFAPALAAGNTVVLKPAEITPLTAIRIGELALEAGLPEHVLNVLPGKGSVVGERFVTHELVRKVCFTGSTEVGKRIMAGCAEQVKKVTLELGGKSSNIVFADADIAAAAASAPYAVFDNAGQDCCARSRILVERSAYDEFLAGLEKSVQALRVLDPSDESSEMGPLVSSGQRASVQGYLDEVEVAFAGSKPDGAGWWIAPSVVTVDDPATRIWREEVFGPVVAVMPFDDEADAVAKANDSEYGLSGSIFTNDLGRGLRVARAVEAGNLSVNSHSSVRYWTPFGGYKQSGLGRELGPDAPMAFTEEKNVFIAHYGEVTGTRILSGPDAAKITENREAAMAGRIQDRVAVVTGGCSGIGLATVRRFVAEGAKVVIGDLSDDRGAEIVEELGGSDVATYVHVDVTDKDQVDALFQTAKDTYGSVDIAFNNAGISPPEDDSILDTDLDAWRRVQEVNLTSVYLCCKAALPHMLEQGRGSIINTASFVAVMGAATSQISYSASKGGVLSMTRELGVQFARQGVRVNALCPGPVNTPLLQELFAKDPERAARRLVHIPMGRFGEPDEMASAVLFLASDDSSFMTANTFLVDGGITGAYVTPV